MPLKHQVWEIDDLRLPVKLHIERRSRSRISIGKKAVLVRIPSGLSAKSREKQVNWFRNWLKKLIKKSPEAVSHLTIETLPNQFSIIIWDEKHTIHPTIVNTNKIKANYSDRKIRVSIPNFLSEYKQKRHLIKLLSKVIAKAYNARFTENVNNINNEYFNVKYNKVKLKYMTSRWGSCSNKGNLNFSTRLLLCPSSIIDYVIVHELAHRIEMSHSYKFWNIVEKVMPDYRKAEKWLKLNGAKADFIPPDIN